MGAVEFYMRQAMAIVVIIVLAWFAWQYFNPCKNGGVVCSALSKLGSLLGRTVSGLFSIGASGK